MQILKSLLIVALVAGCQGMSDSIEASRYIKDAYDGSVWHKAQIGGEKWVVRDHTDTAKLLVAVDIDRYVDTAPPKGIGLDIDEFRPAAVSYLKAKKCNVASGRILNRGIAEFDYTC